jgi:hypothetical protein
VQKVSGSLVITKAVIILISALCSIPTFAQQIERSLEGIEVEPFGRMIRPCCVFGYNLPVFGFPAKMGYTTSSEKLGNHKFYGGEGEINGIIYTRDGGFVDIGHLRDNADMTAYFASQISHNLGKDFVLKTNHEAGKRVIEISLKSRELSSSDILMLGQRITYELAVWHEIRTYFGVPTHYPIHEVQSAFSPEDLYSNLLGTYVGRWAIEREGLYEKEVDTVIQEFLIKLGKVNTEEETKAAMDDVLGVWWQRVSLPSRKFLLAWNTKAYGEITPWLIPDHAKFFNTPTHVYPLAVPEFTESGIPLNDLFTIRIKPISKIPVKKIFKTKTKKEVTQKDFQSIVTWIENKLYVPATDAGVKP